MEGHEIEYLATEIIIKYKSDVVKKLADPVNRKSVFDELLHSLPQGSNINKNFERFGRLVIEVISSDDIFILIDQLERIPLVEYAEPNIINRGSQVIPNEYNSLTALQINQWALNRIRAPWS